MLSVAAFPISPKFFRRSLASDKISKVLNTNIPIITANTSNNEITADVFLRSFVFLQMLFINGSMQFAIISAIRNGKKKYVNFSMIYIISIRNKK